MNRMPGFAVDALLATARRHMEQPPSQVLGADADDPYLRRWFLEKTRDGSVYVHETLRSDAEEELHDHPGESMSIVLAGLLREHLVGGSRLLSPGDVVVRGALDRHRLEVIEPSVTIFVMGPRVHQWGFWGGDDGERFTDSQTFFRQRGYF